MTRFFADKSRISGNLIALDAGDAAHIRSLRLRPSELFVVCDGEGVDHICRLSERGGEPSAEIVETRPARGEPDIHCSVYIALAKGDRLDYAVQKSVELGAYDVFLYPSNRCVSVPGDMRKKTARFQRIALETAKQCGRGRVPEVAALPTFESAIRKAARAGLPLFFYECEEELSLKEALENPEAGKPESPEKPDSPDKPESHEKPDSPDKPESPEKPENPFTISVVTGPEGGFEPHEAGLARSAGMLTVTLGPRVLRCETAPVAALAAIMFQTGNL